MIKKLSTLLFILTVLTAAIGRAQDKTAFDKGLYAEKGDTLKYRILFPVQFDPNTKYPLIIVLHGAGERGNNNEAQLAYGTNLFLSQEVRQQYQAIVVYPQCPADSYWSNVDIQKDSLSGKRKFYFQEAKAEPTKAMKALMGLTQELLDKPYVNKKQVYIGGLSMGGMGTYEMLRRKTKVFAAAFAICGGDNTLNAKIYAKKVPLWIFHGAKDNVVPVDHSEVMVAAIREAGGDPRYTVYPKALHDSWTQAFAEPDLLPWLFSHKK
ncbi:prolyl oligopeptidase family serine peptidase [Mucilaginibacter sp. UR6-1]|uniref:carboxylesterase family protein n=1 Tax=Mucilaginibacter sp. UR6-1 TaxID=1435643 RepID=UPI001E49E7AA|nr:prolyl oligopeptidase family serine peptidase [Mucilaginibacter sp. UR6-1]MCC8410460.1 prolyl oligopeptidase family serine peptidase [Mucilaginibacter sp. UR6-1]